MRGLKALRGLASLTSSTLIEGIETATRALSTAPDLKSVLKEKIPAQQVCLTSVTMATRAAGQQKRILGSMSLVDLCVLMAGGTRAATYPIIMHCDHQHLELCTLSLYGGHYLPQERLKALKKAHGGKELGKVTVDMAIGGMRGITVSRELRFTCRRWCKPH